MGFASSGVTSADVTSAVNTAAAPELDWASYPDLTPALFQANAFINGTTALANMAKLNDGTVASGGAYHVNDFAILDLGAFYKIKQWRQYGQTDNVADGEFTIDVLTGAGWQNWAIFPTRVATWTTLATLPAVAARWLRLKNTVQDSFGQSGITEVEVIF